MTPARTPPFPPGCPARFRTTVHGTIFADRARLLDLLRPGDVVVLVPGPPVEPEPGVWVHLPNGDLIGHLPAEIAGWLAPWMLGGGLAFARVLRVHGPHVPSWRRLVLDVECRLER